MDRKTNIIKKNIKEFIYQVNKKFKLDKALLFGSRARGDYLIDSDVDLILISNDFEKLPFRKRMGEVLDLWKGDVDLEVICYTPIEFKKLKNMFGLVSQAVKEGIEIV